MNSLQSTRQILERSPLLKAKVESGELILISGVYDVDTGHVRFDSPMSGARLQSGGASNPL